MGKHVQEIENQKKTFSGVIKIVPKHDKKSKLTLTDVLKMKIKTTKLLEESYKKVSKNVFQALSKEKREIYTISQFYDLCNENERKTPEGDQLILCFF